MLIILVKRVRVHDHCLAEAARYSQVSDHGALDLTGCPESCIEWRDVSWNTTAPRNGGRSLRSSANTSPASSILL